jgi:hypothetical protein
MCEELSAGGEMLGMEGSSTIKCHVANNLGPHCSNQLPLCSCIWDLEQLHADTVSS